MCNSITSVCKVEILSVSVGAGLTLTTKMAFTGFAHEISRETSVTETFKRFSYILVN